MPTTRAASAARGGARRPLDLVLYGATGFTGRLTAAYLARHAPAGVKVALAGRDAAKLDALRAELASVGVGGSFTTVVAAGQEQLDALAASTTAVITTAGPFALYGEPLLAACARAGTHYADLTGESFWMARMAAKYGGVAAASGAILVPACGFDSVPADLGVFLLQSHARAAHGSRVADVTAVMTGTGNVSGGTVASALNMLRDPVAGGEGADPLCYFPRTDGVDPLSVVAPVPDAVGLPWWEPATRTWAATWVMAAVNTRVVRRSAGLYAQPETGRKLAGCPAALPPLPAGTPDPHRYCAGPFRYGEVMGRRSYLGALALNAGAGAGEALMRLPGVLSLAARWLPKPGQGPSAEARAAAHFTYYLTGVTEPAIAAEASAGAGADATAGAPRRRLTVAVSGGDGGYDETSKMLAEAGLALATQVAELPGAALGGGVLTPATALGRVLVDRLNAAGLKMEVVTDEPAAEL